MAGKRRRITIINSQLNDPDEYKQNSCSPNAKQIELFSETVDIELWVDKHYSVRNQFGDDDGSNPGEDQAEASEEDENSAYGS